MSKFKIDNIFPSVDERGNDIITFEVNERKVYEKIDDRNDLAKDEKSALVDEFKFSEADARAINEGLQKWVDANTDTRFARNSSHPYVETVEYGLHASKDEIAVFLTAEGNAKLSLDNGYSLQGSRVLYDSPEFGAQVYDNSPVDEPFSAVVKAYYDTPESHIETIALKHEEMREKAKLLERTPGETVANIEVVDAENKLMAKFDVIKTYDDLTQKTFSASEFIDLDDGLLIDASYEEIKANNGVGVSSLEAHNSGDFEHDEVIATVNRHLKANPISERTLDKYRAAAESEKEDEDKDRLVAS